MRSQDLQEPERMVTDMRQWHARELWKGEVSLLRANSEGSSGYPASAQWGMGGAIPVSRRLRRSKGLGRVPQIRDHHSLVTVLRPTCKVLPKPGCAYGGWGNAPRWEITSCSLRCSVLTGPHLSHCVLFNCTCQ